MKTWHIPAKTFLVGEYAALAGMGGIILTTTPCFELTLTETAGLNGIHIDSPAGRWWQKNGDKRLGLSWMDPFNQIGGVGASSAQFIGAYLATSLIHQQTPTQEAMLDAYWESAWSGEGLKPSGYDVIAQTMSECVFINQKQQHYLSFPWRFSDIALIIAHSGNKLATHHHLHQTTLPDNLSALDAIVEEAKKSFIQNDSHLLIAAINHYHHRLKEMGLVALTTLELIHLFEDDPEILAVKGCGAMGADTLLFITKKEASIPLSNKLTKMGLKILATDQSLSSRERNERS